jgi:hypothetical protein
VLAQTADNSASPPGVRWFSDFPLKQDQSGHDEEDCLEFNKKVGSDENAIVFDYDVNDSQWVASVFEDGLEAFNVNLMSLENIDIILEDFEYPK